MKSNPFTITTPENLDAHTVLELFENIFTDIPSINQIGHVFIHGARGSGKSMLFKYMLPEVQSELLDRNSPRKIERLPYYSFYLPIKQLELTRLHAAPLSDSQKQIVYSHYLNIRVCLLIAESIDSNSQLFSEKSIDVFCKYMINAIEEYGMSRDIEISAINLELLKRSLLKEVTQIDRYLGQLAMGGTPEYNLGISSFIDIVIPALKRLTGDHATNFYLLIDDADELPEDMQRILNTWVSYRTTNILSLKISTQLRYATYRTLSGSSIEFPHDFTPVDLTQIYTSKIDNYQQRLERIVQRRLKFYGFNPDVISFFPEDEEQSENITLEEQEIRSRHISGLGTSSRVSDDIYRYSVPNYMTRLLETKKSNIFKYAGFKCLANISSGTIRYFLEPANRMYAALEDNVGDIEIDFIPPELQNRTVRDWSEERVKSALDGLVDDDNSRDDIVKLKNMLDSLGKLFASKLLDRNSTERRVFSIFTDTLPEDIERIVTIGVSYGYLQRSTIRSKERVGRKDEIILSRTLAPKYYLDPTGYSGRLSVTIPMLRLSMESPDKFVRERLKFTSEQQNTLFDDLE
ncbi:hypothetical protein WDJ50_11380 [Deinococcus sp. VB142]|uniref:KAP NTPase domain-containing protein n=1 Tax=Deinococcus sp. VB142 TaxID=3112952 RepID=A0AAU6Q062_9DEIO